jgi:hypothetical protein
MNDMLPKYPYTGRRFPSKEAFEDDKPILPYNEITIDDRVKWKVNPDWIDAPYYEVLDHSAENGYHRRLVQL